MDESFYFLVLLEDPREISSVIEEINSLGHQNITDVDPFDGELADIKVFLDTEDEEIIGQLWDDLLTLDGVKNVVKKPSGFLASLLSQLDNEE